MAKWGYGPSNGPSTWAKDCPLANGDNQSPVDIVSGSAVKAAMPALSINCVAEDSVSITNAGWTMIAGCSKGSAMSGGPLGGNYKLASFHFHWGKTDAAGSEHTIDGKQSAAELHIVYYNADKYGSFADASGKADGLGIVAVMCNVGGDLGGAKDIIAGASKVSGCGAKDSVSGAFDPKCLFPGNTSDYFSYHGSLTCPPCTENVEWIVMKDAISVSSGQLASLRTIKDGDGNALVQNFRGPCPLKGRTIKKSF